MERIEAGMSVMTLKKQTYRVIAVINQGQELLVRAHEPETADIEIIPVTTVVQVTEQNSTGDAAVALDTVTVVGERYVDDIVATLTTLRVGMAVLLQRESGNQYDDNAISVWTLQHAKLGYIARYQNQPYAALMDQGQRLYGIVTVLDGELSN